jgi:hypothetical protein
MKKGTGRLMAVLAAAAVALPTALGPSFRYAREMEERAMVPHQGVDAQGTDFAPLHGADAQRDAEAGVAGCASVRNGRSPRPDGA